MVRAILLFCGATLAACDSPQCALDSHCAVGSYCANGACVTMCAADEECAELGEGARCSTFGRCVMPSPTDGGMTCEPDLDGDGRCATDDCDDTDDRVYRGAEELCGPTYTDEDCDGAIDEHCGWFFGAPHVVLPAHVAGDAAHVAPQLSVDGLALTFVDGTSGSVWRSTRASMVEPFTAPVSELVTTDPLAWAHVRDDGLEVIYEVASASTVMRATRASTAEPFGVPELVASAARSPRLSFDGLELYVEQTMPAPSHLARATRANTSAAFGPLEPLVLPGASVRDYAPALTPDGRTLLFAREAPTGRSRLYAAERSTSGFDAPMELANLELPDASFDGPWYSPSTRELFFASAGAWAPALRSIYRVEVCRDAPCAERVIACDAGLRSEDRLHCYRWLNTPAAFDVAQERCEARGGYLATVHSRAEGLVVRALTAGTPAWLGASDEAAEGTWLWVSGEPWLGTFWATGEPNNAGMLEHCMSAPCMNATCSVGMDWNDLPCTAMQPHVCETELWPTW
jgi:hypothetical protein